MTEYVNLLDTITESRTLPDGYDAWGIRSVRPDFTSRQGYRYPYPGNVATALGPFNEHHSGGCPSAVGDGICLANTWAGMASGSVPAITLLLCAYRTSDVLGTEPDNGKLRLREFLVVELIDGVRLVREHGAGADLSRADLSRADLSGADLSGADLSGAYLSRADLSRANLSGADLSRADLSGANLSGAYLSGANLSGANLSGADLSRANLSGANLSGANLSGANLSRANLSGANLSGAIGYERGTE